VENTGAFLSMGDSLPELLRILLFIILPVALLVAALFYLFLNRNLSFFGRTGVALLIGGGIGNLIDRIVYGSVTDFLHIDLMFAQTGVFNMADVSIMTGFFMLLFDKFFLSDNSRIPVQDKAS
jgi:signal peptidase II